MRLQKQFEDTLIHNNITEIIAARKVFAAKLDVLVRDLDFIYGNKNISKEEIKAEIADIFKTDIDANFNSADVYNKLISVMDNLTEEKEDVVERE